MSLVQEGTMAGLVSFAGLGGGEELFGGECSLFFTLLKKDIMFSALEAINFSNPCKSPSFSISFLVSSLIIFSIGFTLWV